MLLPLSDNEVIAKLTSPLDAAMASPGWNYLVIQKDQPTQQGTPNAPTLFFEKLFDHRYGWPNSSEVYDPEEDHYVVTETQIYETTFQISALAWQDPEQPNMPTASDIVNQAAGYVGSSFIARQMAKNGMSILRVTDVRNPYFGNDESRFEANPNFDITVIYCRKQTFIVPAADRAVPVNGGVIALPDNPVLSNG